MARTPRALSESEVYHVIARGVNRMRIFEDDEDRFRFMGLLAEKTHNSGVELYCWCLMSNHVHLLVHAPNGTLSIAMKETFASYALYFNTRHGRSGHLFQGRFRSEPVNNDEYFLTVVRYIHWNPVKAGMAENCRYRWSSYGEYLRGSGYASTDRALAIFGGLEAFKAFHEARPLDECLDYREDAASFSDAEAVEIAEDSFGQGILDGLKGMDPAVRDAILVELKARGMTIRQLQRLAGIGRSIIQRA